MTGCHKGVSGEPHGAACKRNLQRQEAVEEQAQAGKAEVRDVTGKDLLNKMELVDPEYIETADRMPRKKPIMWQKWAALAASLALAIGAGIWMGFSEGAVIPIDAPEGDYATVFSSGGVALILMISAILASLAIAALIIKDKNQK